MAVFIGFFVGWLEGFGESLAKYPSLLASPQSAKGADARGFVRDVHGSAPWAAIQTVSVCIAAFICSLAFIGGFMLGIGLPDQISTLEGAWSK